MIATMAATFTVPLGAQQQQGGALPRLTMESVTRMAETVKALAAAAENDPSVIVQLDMETSVDQDVARIQASPSTTAVFRKLGVQPRDYLNTMMAYMEAAMIVGMQQDNPGMQIPETANAANVEFIRAHQAELQKLMPQGDE